MNEIQHGFCQHCRALVPLGLSIGRRAAIQEHPAKDADPWCPGSFHPPAVLVFGVGWISWTIAANPYTRHVLIDPPSLEVLEAIRQARDEN